jgi:ParB/RepB/Spo0J family partition protein
MTSPQDLIVTLPDGRKTYPMDQIFIDHKFNCRGNIAPIDVADLADDIRRHGLMQPVIITRLSDEEVTATGKIWRLIAGFRRTVCHRITGDSHIWATDIPVKEEMDARVINLRENLQRKELTFAQEANAIRPFFEKGWSDEKIMKELGAGRGWVQLRKMFLTVPEEIQKEVEAGTVTQVGLREVYTAFKRNGVEAAYQVTREIKDAKIKGLKHGTRNLAKIQNKVRKVVRGKSDILWLLERIMGMEGAGITSSCLAWCGGEINDNDLEDRLKEYLGTAYKAPVL